MSALKNKVSMLSVSVFLSIFSFSSSLAADKLNLDPSTLKIIDEIVMAMQQKTMSSVYAEMPFKDQMRGKMMTERAGQNYMMQVIQPQMVQKNMGAEKLKLMNQMSKF